MKTAIIIADGIKQIMFTAENQSEKQVLAMITPQDDITVEAYTGTFYDSSPESAKGYVVAESKGGYLRGYEDKASLMLVLKPKKEEKVMDEDETTILNNYYNGKYK